MRKAPTVRKVCKKHTMRVDLAIINERSWFSVCCLAGELGAGNIICAELIPAEHILSYLYPQL